MSAKDLEVQEMPEPIGKWIIDNMKEGSQTENGVYFHYSEVCRLVKLMKKECEGKKQPDAESKLNLPVVRQQSELLPKRLSLQVYHKAEQLTYEGFVEWWDKQV